MSWIFGASLFLGGALFDGLSVGAWFVLADAFPSELTEG
jgi:hypothetical protein